MHTVSAAVLPAALALFLVPHHRQESAKTLRIFQSVQPPSRQLAGELLALRPALPRGARVLFLNSPFARDEHVLLFLTRLLYRDMSITVEEASLSAVPPPGYSNYDAVFMFRQGHWVNTPARDVRTAAPCYAGSDG